MTTSQLIVYIPLGGAFHIFMVEFSLGVKTCTSLTLASEYSFKAWPASKINLFGWVNTPMHHCVSAEPNFTG
jgi:hypothetical protein